MKALLVVDLQNDFCLGGALAVPEGDKVVPVLNRYIAIFVKHRWPVFASRDWHPRLTRHFQEQGGSWPAHCVQGTPGARFHPGLCLPQDAVIISKGMDPESDSYSAFDGVDERGMPFLRRLQGSGITELYVGGLATDYCVRHSVLEACRAQFKVYLLMDAVKGVNLAADDARKAVAEMAEAGAYQITLQEMEGDYAAG